MASIWHKATWRKQLLFIVAGGLLTSVPATMLISPTGPGSDRIAYIVLAVYVFFLVLLGPKFTKIIGIVLLCIFLVAIAMETRSRNRFEKKMKAGIEQMEKSNATKLEPTVP